MIGPFEISTVGYALSVAMAAILFAAMISTWRRSPKAMSLSRVCFVTGLLVFCCWYFFFVGVVSGRADVMMDLLQHNAADFKSPPKMYEEADLTVAGGSLLVLIVGAICWVINSRRERFRRAILNPRADT